MIRLATAIKWLKSNYELAVKNEYIRDKVAWALYVTWKEVEQHNDSEDYKQRCLNGVEGEITNERSDNRR